MHKQKTIILEVLKLKQNERNNKIYLNELEMIEILRNKRNKNGNPDRYTSEILGGGSKERQRKRENTGK